MFQCDVCLHAMSKHDDYAHWLCILDALNNIADHSTPDFDDAGKITLSIPNLVYGVCSP